MKAHFYVITRASVTFDNKLITHNIRFAATSHKELITFYTSSVTKRPTSSLLRHNLCYEVIATLHTIDVIIYFISISVSTVNHLRIKLVTLRTPELRELLRHVLAIPLIIAINNSNGTSPNIETTDSYRFRYVRATMIRALRIIIYSHTISNRHVIKSKNRSDVTQFVIEHSFLSYSILDFRSLL